MTRDRAALPPASRQCWIFGESDAGERLDSALGALAGISRSQARRWIDEGRVRLNDSRPRASQKVRQGDVVDADPPEPLPSPLVPEAIPLSLLYEDEDLIVVDKPAGLVVHPAPGHPGGTLVNALLHHCRDLAGVGGTLRPGIVHRLDQGTSGVLVAAKHDAAHRALAAQFQDHSIEREYRALVRGLPGADAGRVERPIGRHPRDRKRMSTAVQVGREARTGWRVLRRFRRSERSWLAVFPETGRTHQIRVHLASAGLPIVGDPVYGRAGRQPQAGGAGPQPATPRSGRAARRSRAKADPRREGPRSGRAASQRRAEGGPPQGLASERRGVPARPALHAAVLGFTHPRSGERLRFEAPLPQDLAELLAELERLEGGA